MNISELKAKYKYIFCIKQVETTRSHCLGNDGIKQQSLSLLA